MHRLDKRPFGINSPGFNNLGFFYSPEASRLYQGDIEIFSEYNFM